MSSNGSGVVFILVILLSFFVFSFMLVGGFGISIWVLNTFFTLVLLFLLGIFLIYYWSFDFGWVSFLFFYLVMEGFMDLFFLMGHLFFDVSFFTFMVLFKFGLFPFLYYVLFFYSEGVFLNVVVSSVFVCFSLFSKVWGFILLLSIPVSFEVVYMFSFLSLLFCSFSYSIQLSGYFSSVVIIDGVLSVWLCLSVPCWVFVFYLLMNSFVLYKALEIFSCDCDFFVFVWLLVYMGVPMYPLVFLKLLGVMSVSNFGCVVLFFWSVMLIQYLFLFFVIVSLNMSVFGGVSLMSTFKMSFWLFVVFLFILMVISFFWFMFGGGVCYVCIFL